MYFHSSFLPYKLVRWFLYERNTDFKVIKIQLCENKMFVQIKVTKSSILDVVWILDPIMVFR